MEQFNETTFDNSASSFGKNVTAFCMNMRVIHGMWMVLSGTWDTLGRFFIYSLQKTQLFIG